MKKLVSVFLTLFLLTFGSTCLFSIIKVGDEIAEKVETTHPYMGGHGVVFEREFHWPNAGYIAIHFSNFNLRPGDYLEISSPDGQFGYLYDGRGKVVRDGQAVLSEFWASHIPGDTAVVKLHARNPKGGWGFTIDKWVHGYEQHVIQALMIGDEEDIANIQAICNSDDKKWAKCYLGTTMYEKARAVARLLMNGSTACTGWLLGSEGHLMTNNHCIGSQSTADNTDYEFMAEGATCTTGCASWLACPGVVEATSGSLIKSDSSLDYSLVLLPTNITSTYGYLQFRDTLPTIGERMYIPQHPGAWGKQLAVDSDVDGGFCVVYSTNQTPCTGGPGDIGYYCDTAGGSSGSPVLAYGDHLVISLHHCATCPNRGLQIPPIITHMGSALPNDAIGGCALPPPAAPSNLTANAVACNQVDLAWNDNSNDESGFDIERSTNGVNFVGIASVGADITSFSDTTVAENTTYWYRVKANNCGGDSGYSNVASDTTPTCPCVTPAAPSGVKAKGLPGRISLSWTDNSNNEDGFRIYRGLSPSTLSLVVTVGPNTTSYLDTGLQSKTTYYYKVCAYNTCGEACSAIVSGTTK